MVFFHRHIPVSTEKGIGEGQGAVGGARQPVWWGAGGLGAGAEEEWKPRERRRDPLWALIAGTFSFSGTFSLSR